MIVLFSIFSTFSPVANQLVAHSHANDDCCCIVLPVAWVSERELSHACLFHLSLPLFSIRHDSASASTQKCPPLFGKAHWIGFGCFNVALDASKERCVWCLSFLLSFHSFAVALLYSLSVKVVRWCVGDRNPLSVHFICRITADWFFLLLSTFFQIASPIFCLYLCHMPVTHMVRFDLKLQVIYRWQLLWTDEGKGR